MTFKIGADKGAHSVFVLLDPRTASDRNFIKYVIAGMYFCYFAPFLLSMVSFRVVFLAHFSSTQFYFFFFTFCMPSSHSKLTTLRNFRYLKTNIQLQRRDCRRGNQQSGVTDAKAIWISGDLNQRSVVLP